MQTRTILILTAAAALGIAQDSHDHAKSLVLEMQRRTADGNLPGVRELVPAAEQEIRRLGLAHPNAASLVNQVAILEQVLGNYAAAERIYASAIKRLEEIDPEGLSLAMLLLNLARTHLEAADGPSHAYALGQRALTLTTRHFGSNSSIIGMCYNTLGVALSQQGEYRQAQRLFERALLLSHDGSELDKYQVAVNSLNLGALELRDAKWQIASRHLNDGVRLQTEIYGPMASSLIRPLLSLARLHIKRKEWIPANESAAKARAIAGAQLGENHPIRAEILAISVEIARKTGHRAEARERELELRALLPSKRNPTVHVTDLAREARK